MAKRKAVKRRAHAPKPTKHSKTTRSSNKLLMEPIDYNKTLFTASVITFLSIVFLLVAFSNAQKSFTTGGVITGYDVGSAQAATNAQSGNWYSLIGQSPFVTVLQYVFGAPIQLATIASSIIVTIAVWLLLLVTFGDIIASFSSFHKWVSWVIAGLMTLIMANVGVVVQMTIAVIKVFAFAGTFAVYAGLGTAFAVFVLVNFGVARAGAWIMNRRALMHGASAKAETQSGAEAVAGTVHGLISIGHELKSEGKRLNK